jgi:hypothetical protein
MLGILLSGCAKNREVLREAPQYRFDTPLQFNVKNIDVVNSYVAPKKEPHVDHLMSYTLDDALVEWAHHRLRPTPHTHGYGVVVVETASIKRKPLPKKNGIMTTFTRQESDEYEAHGAVRMDFMDRRGYPIGAVFARSKHMQTVLEGITPDQLQHVWASLSQKVVDDLNNQIEKNIRREIPRLLNE